MACVCKLFRDPALDALYFKVLGVSTVFMTLPKDSWKIDNKGFSFTRPLEMIDWERVFQYSRRVRRLFEPKGASTQLSEEAYEIICISPYPLFPSLQNLEWRSDEFSGTFALYCSGPKMTKMDLLEMPSDFFPSLSTISVRCHNLRELEVQPASFEDSGNLRSALEEALPTMRALRKLSLRLKPSKAVLQAIDKLPSLEELKIWALTNSELRTSSSARNLDFSFTPLRSLCICDSPFVAIGRTLDCIGGLPRVETFEGISTAGEGVEHALRSLASQLDPVCLSVVSLSSFTSGSSTEAPLNVTGLSSLKHFLNITRISISINMRLSFDDADISTISSSWPKLAYLQLEGGDRSNWFRDKRLTFRGLQTLLHNCPQLQYVDMPIDARHHYEPFSLTNPRHQNLSTLSVGWALIEDRDVQPIASFLGSLTEKRLVVHSWNSVWSSERSLTFQKRWEKVNQLISAFHAEGESRGFIAEIH